MNELEELRARAAERRAPSYEPYTNEEIKQAEADLDRAIAGWEDQAETNDTLVVAVRGVAEERDKAIAAAKALREALYDHEQDYLVRQEKVLAETAWLENK